jgi:hypothetical protein
VSLAAFLQHIVRVLEASGVPYMLTGSLAAAYYAIPRATQDVDVVVDGDASDIANAVSRFLADGLYVSPEAAAEAVATRGQFNVIDSETGWKADVIIRKQRPFSEMEFSRRGSAHLLGVELTIVTLEDLVIAKLEWASKGESEHQLRDVAQLLRAGGDVMDRKYVERWVASLGLTGQWTRVTG